jgi:hypothetical protein
LIHAETANHYDSDEPDNWVAFEQDKSSYLKDLEE